MYKKPLSFILVSFLIQLMCITSVSAVVPTETETQRIAKMKERISVIQLEKKRVIIKRRDGTKIKGALVKLRTLPFS